MKLSFNITQVCQRCLLLFAVMITLTANVSAQTIPSPSTIPTASPTPQVSPAPSLEKHFFKNILRDQQAIWTSPFRLRGRDAKWLVPLGVSTAALIATDRRTSAFVSRNGSLPAVSRDFSQGGSFYATGSVAAGLYIIGRSTDNRRMREPDCWQPRL